MARSSLDCGYVMRKGAKVWLPWLLEQPLRKEGKPHAFNLKWILPLHDHEAVSDEDIAQCNAGAATTKPTSLRATFKTGIDPDCKHPCKWWTIPWSGHSYFSPHEAIWSTMANTLQRMACQHETMVRALWPIHSDSAAAYPGLTNKIIALRLIFQAKDVMLGIAERDNRAMVESGKWSNVRLAPHLLKQKPN